MKKSKDKREEENKATLHGVPLEKSDTLAIIIAACTTVLPFALFIIFLFYLFAKWFFKF